MARIIYCNDLERISTLNKESKKKDLRHGAVSDTGLHFWGRKKSSQKHSQ